MTRRVLMAMLCVAAVSLSTGCGSSSKSKQSYQLNGRLITLQTQPPGARVIQFAPPTGDRVDLGMTPLVNQPVMVMTGMKGYFTGAGNIGALMSQMNVARVRVEKDGYQPYEGSLATDPKRVVEHAITLEPAGPATRPASASAATPGCIWPAALSQRSALQRVVRCPESARRCPSARFQPRQNAPAVVASAKPIYSCDVLLLSALSQVHHRGRVVSTG